MTTAVCEQAACRCELGRFRVTARVVLVVDAESHVGASGDAAALISDAISAAIAAGRMTCELQEVQTMGAERET